MIKVQGNEILISPKHRLYPTIKMALTKSDENGLPVKLYKLNSRTRQIKFAKGLVSILPNLGLPIEDLEGSTDIANKINILDLRDNILPNITLRDDQMLVIMRCLMHRRGIVQAATASGKTYMICGLLANINYQIGYYPDTLILVPTLYLMNQMIKVMESVGIQAKPYSEVRGGISGIVVAHPQSIINDLSKGMDLSNIKILIGDEAHHAQSSTWSQLFIKSVNANYILGFSASIIASKRLPITKITQLSINEAITFGCTGNIIIDLPTSYYRGKGVLAVPKVIRVEHKANERVPNEKNWHQIRKIRLESEARSDKIASIAKEFSNRNLKVLILVSTHEHGYRILDKLDELGLSKISICSYGSSKFYKNTNGVRESLPSDSMTRFESGEFKIMIGSSHIYEGADIPNLDVVILGVVGKSIRRVIQAVGRGLRRSKSGKYSYIIDFTDTGGGVLAYHAYQRLVVYKEQIGIESSDIIDKVPISKLGILLSNLEDIEEE